MSRSSVVYRLQSLSGFSASVIMCRMGVSCYNSLSEDVEMAQWTLSTTVKELLADSTEKW